jgi:hypothetical protein
MQNIKEKPLEKNEKNSHSKDKKQNNESFANILKSDISDSFEGSNSFMSVKAIGVRMAKLQHKLKYTNVLAPSLKDLPDYCPSNPTYSFKLDTNKNNIHKCDINTKPSTSSSDNQIIFENYTNKSINITNNNKNKGNGKKRKGDNVKKTTKKSKKLKKESLSNKTVLKTNNEKQTKESKESNNIINPEIKTLTNSTERINIIKNEDEALSSSTIDSKMSNRLPEQELKNFSAFVDNSICKRKEDDQELILNKKEIKHKKIKLSFENNMTENIINTTTNISNQAIASNESINKTNLNNSLQMNAIQNSINNSNIMVSPVLFNKGVTLFNTSIYNVNINNKQNSLSCVGSIYKNNKNTNITNNIVNDNVLNKIYTKKSKIQQPQIKSQSTPLSTSATYLTRNIVSPQSYPQGYNCKYKGDLYQVKSQPSTQLLTQQLSSINQSSPQSQNALCIREGYIKQQQQQFESQKINRLLQTRRHQYLYVNNGSQRYGSYPAPSSQQQYYYHQTKSSSYPGIAKTNLMSSLSPTEMKVNPTLINTASSTINTSKSNNFSQKQYPKQTTLKNFVNLPMSNNSPLTMNSINYMSTSSLSPLNLSTTSINTNANERNFPLISPVLQNRAVLYPKTVVQSPNEKNIVASTRINSTPILSSQGHDINNNDIVNNSNTMYQSSNTIISQGSESLSSLEKTSLKDNKISQNPSINYNSMIVNNDTSNNNNLMLAENNYVKIVEDEATNNTMVDRNILTFSNNAFESLNESSTLNNHIENSQIVSDDGAGLKNATTSSSIISKAFCEDNNNLLEVSESLLLTGKALKVEEGSSNSTLVNQGNELNSNSDINLSMVDNEKTINNEVTLLSSTPYLNNKDTLSSIYTPSLSTKDNFNENPNILYENITPPFSTKVSPLILTKSELSSDELTNSLNKIKSSSINEYINSPYIVSSVPSNTSISLIEDDKEILKEKNYSITLGDNNELIQSGNLNGVSTSDPTPLELLNLNNSSQNEAIGGISSATTHPTIFKQNGNEFYTIPLTMDNTGLPSVTTIQSPQYKSTETLPLTPISSRSISSSYS